MSKFDQVRTYKNMKLDSIDEPVKKSKFAGLRTRSNFQKEYTAGNRIASTHKALASGVIGGLVDGVANLGWNLPAMGANYLLEKDYPFTGSSAIAKKITGKDKNFIPLIPSATDAIDNAYDNITVGYTETPPNQKHINNAARFTGDMLSGGLVKNLGQFAKKEGLKKLGATFGSTKAPVLAGSGAAGGAISYLEDQGASTPESLAAAVAISSFINNGKNIYNTGKNFKFKIPKSKKNEIEISKQLKEQIGEKDLTKVLKNLDNPLPLGVKGNTAELSNNLSLAALHRAKSPNIPELATKTASNDEILRKEILKLSNQTGNSSEKIGNIIRKGLDKNLTTAKNKRAAITEPLYKAVEEIKDGVSTSHIDGFLYTKKQYAKGDQKKALDYIENLVASNKTNKKLLKQIEDQYSKLSPKALDQLKSAVKAELLPIELNNAIADINGRISVAKRAGNNSLAKLYTDAKKNIELDLDVIPERAIANNKYHELSKPVSEIKDQKLLGKIVEKDIHDKGFIMSSEKIPEKILSGTLDDTKALMKQAKGNTRVIESIRASITNEILSKTELASMTSSNAHKISYDKYKKFYKNNKEKLSLVFDKNQMQVLDDVRTILARRQFVESAGRAIGSNTQSELTLLETLSNRKSFLRNNSFRKIPVLKYVMPILNSIQDAKKNQTDTILEKALISPAFAKNLLTPVKEISSKEQMQFLLQPLLSTSDYVMKESERYKENMRDKKKLPPISERPAAKFLNKLGDHPLTEEFNKLFPLPWKNTRLERKWSDNDLKDKSR